MSPCGGDAVERLMLGSVSDDGFVAKLEVETILAAEVSILILLDAAMFPMCGETGTWWVYSMDSTLVRSLAGKQKNKIESSQENPQQAV